MRLALPIWIFEPTTSLTRMAESFEFSHLLDRAAASPDPVHRDAFVTAFVLSTFSHTERVKKPFNPVLGETYHFVDNAANLRFYAEQVSHHPPISAAHIEGTGWLAGEVVDGHMAFHRTSVEITNVGSRFIHLTATNDRYTWTLPRTLLSNLLIGGSTVDHVGTVDIYNHTTGTRSTLEFPKRGWFAHSQNAVTGDMRDRSGSKLALLKGVWNHHLDWERVGTAPPSDLPTRLWATGPRKIANANGDPVSGPFSSCSPFTRQTIYLDDKLRSQLPPTDSRLRPDRLALESGDSARAAEEKLRVEQLQRERRAFVARAVANGGSPHTPRFFEKTLDGKAWKPKGTYWLQSRQRLSDEERRNASLW